jgi:hypothetical protein
MKNTKKEILEKFDIDQKDYLFPMWRNTNMPALDMKVNTYVKSKNWFIVFQDLAANWANGSVDNIVIVYSDTIEGNKTFYEPISENLDFNSKVDLENFEISLKGKNKKFKISEEVLESKELKMALDEIFGDKSMFDPNAIEWFKALYAVAQQEKEDLYLSKKEIGEKMKCESLKEIAEYTDWDELDLANDELPSQNEFFINLAEEVENCAN